MKILSINGNKILVNNLPYCNLSDIDEDDLISDMKEINRINGSIFVYLNLNVPSKSAAAADVSSVGLCALSIYNITGSFVNKLIENGIPLNCEFLKKVINIVSGISPENKLALELLDC